MTPISSRLCAGGEVVNAERNTRRRVDQRAFLERSLPFVVGVVGLDPPAGGAHQRHHERAGASRVKRVETRGDTLPHTVLREQIAPIDGAALWKVRRYETNRRGKRTLAATGGSRPQLHRDVIHTDTQESVFVSVCLRSLFTPSVDRALQGAERLGIFLHAIDKHALRRRRRGLNLQFGVRSHDSRVRTERGAVERSLEISGAEEHAKPRFSLALVAASSSFTKLELIDGSLF